MNEVKDLKNVYSLDWKELSTKALEHTKDIRKYRVYKEFYNKYMDIQPKRIKGLYLVKYQDGLVNFAVVMIDLLYINRTIRNNDK